MRGTNCINLRQNVEIYASVLLQQSAAACCCCCCGSNRGVPQYSTGHGPRCCQQQMQSAKKCDTLYKLCRKRQRPIASGVVGLQSNGGASKLNQIEQRQRCQGQLRANCLPRQFVGLSHRLTARLASWLAGCLAAWPHPPLGKCNKLLSSIFRCKARGVTFIEAWLKR